MPDYPKEFEFDVLLSDGRVIQLRPIRPDDAERERAFIARVGPQSSYFRFFQVRKELSPEELRYFTNVDYDDRMAFIALHGEDMVAVGRYDVMHEKSSSTGRVAEVAFLVEDAFQGLGIGSHLLQHLTVYARLKEITAFEAYVLSENRAMLRLFRDSGYRLTRQLEEGCYEVEFPIEYSLEAQAAEWEHEKRAVTASLMPILYPRSVAVIGASRNDRSIGGRIFTNVLMRGFTGPVYPVNPNAAFVHAVKAYPSIRDIPDPIDLAIIVVPAPLVPLLVEECGQKGVRGVVIISSGFRSRDDGDTSLERALVAAARRHGMRLIGPNCMGLINTDDKISLDGQFGPTFPPAGTVSMASQSGALGLAMLEEATRLNVGISTFVSLGDRADVSPMDLLLYWEDDPATDVITLYVESFGNPRRFGRLTKRVGRKKPVVVVKGGRSTVARPPSEREFRWLADLDVAVDTLFRQAGVIQCRTLQELFDVTALLANQPLPEGRRTAVLSNAAGPAMLAVDALAGAGLEVPLLSDELRGRIVAAAPGAAGVRNPIDLSGSADPEAYRACLSLLLESNEVDAVIVAFIPTDPKRTDDVARAVDEAAAAGGRRIPVLGVFMGSADTRASMRGGSGRIPVYPYPESAADALGRAAGYHDWRERPEGEHIHFTDIERTESEQLLTRELARLGPGGGAMAPGLAEQLLGLYSIRTARTEWVKDEREAIEASERLGGPVVVKVVSPTLACKSDVGGVVLGVEGAEAVGAAFRQVMSAADDAEGALVQEYFERGHDVIVGMREDPQFGPLVVFGLGGIYVELMHDVTYRINPLTDLDAREMIADVRSAQVLSGYRGSAPGDREALVDLILRVSTLIEHHPQVVEIDLEPVRVLSPGDGVAVLDARIHLRPIPGSLSPTRKDIPGRML